jgi:hypothetical protein
MESFREKLAVGLLKRETGRDRARYSGAVSTNPSAIDERQSCDNCH